MAIPRKLRQNTASHTQVYFLMDRDMEVSNLSNICKYRNPLLRLSKRAKKRTFTIHMLLLCCCTSFSEMTLWYFLYLFFLFFVFFWRKINFSNFNM